MARFVKLRSTVEESSSWVCPRCTLENTGMRCAACDGPRVVVAHPVAAPPPPYEPPREVSEFLTGEGGDECVVEVRVTSDGALFESRLSEPSALARQRLATAFPVVSASGEVGGAETSFVENLANAGRAGGEADAPEPRRGGRQSRDGAEADAPDRRRGGRQSRDGGGRRVNAPTTAGPVYDNSPIDDQGTLFGRRASPASADVAIDIVPVEESRADAPLAVEVAAVGAKLRNMSKVGGERVREMDHYVESVKTRIVDVVADRKAAVEKAKDRLPPSSKGSLVAIGCAVERRDLVEAYARVFKDVLHEAAALLAVRPDLELYYLPSVRANDFVCALDPTDGKLYVNVLPFQQARVACRLRDGLPIGLEPSAWPEILPYWTHRLATALKHPGLFDTQVRARLADRLFDLAGEAPGFDIWAQPNDGGHHVALPLGLEPLRPIDDSDLLCPT